VFPIFVDADRGNCSNGSCHGSAEMAGADIFLPADDPSAFYDGLIDVSLSGRRFVDTEEPEESILHCSIAGRDGGGDPIPRPGGLPSKADVRMVEDWVMNGAPGPLARSDEPPP
jgi:hypothetical protein